MGISTRWEHDGSLIVACGEEEIVVTPAGLAQKKVSSPRKKAAGSASPASNYLFLRTITPGKPGFTCDVVEQMPKVDCRSVTTVEELKNLLIEANADKVLNKLYVTWDYRGPDTYRPSQQDDRD